MTVRSRSFSLLSVAAALAFCCSCSAQQSSGIPEDQALRVGEWTLSNRDFLDELSQVAANQTYIDARTAGNRGVPFQVFRQGTGEPTPTVAAEFLNERVSFRLAQDELRKRNVTVTDADRRQAIGLLGASLQRSEQQPEQSTSTGGTQRSGPVADSTTGALAEETRQRGQAVLDGFTGSYRQVLLDGVSSLVALQRVLTGVDDLEAKMRELYEMSKEEACVSQILVKPNAEAGRTDPATGQPFVASESEYQTALLRATELRAKIVGGADFYATARESSEDSTKDKGGDLGCRARGAYVDEFDRAVWQLSPGSVSEPVRTPFGYHLIMVRERRIAPFEEARPALEQAVQEAQSEALQQWLNEATRTAKVEVNQAYGRWDPFRGTITPAAGQEPTLTLSPLESVPAGAPGPAGTAGAPTSTSGTQGGPSQPGPSQPGPSR